MALGANVLNMALVPAAFVALGKRFTALRTRDFAVAALACCSVPLAALLIVGETALFRSTEQFADWAQFAWLMVGTHAWIGLLEGFMTAAILPAAGSFAVSTANRFVWRRAAFGVAACLLVAAMFLPISSSLPDGYEAAAQASGLGWLLGK